MRTKTNKDATANAAPRESHCGIDEQINALEQERLRLSVSERLVHSLTESKYELNAAIERNRRRIERLEGQLRLIPEAEQTALLATMHVDLERLLAAYWFFVVAQMFPSTAAPASISDPTFIAEALNPFSELLFE